MPLSAPKISVGGRDYPLLANVGIYGGSDINLSDVRMAMEVAQPLFSGFMSDPT
jgi:hypothetical protein